MARIIVLFGLTASGKSTLAQALSKRLGLTWFNTDHVRKELAGLTPSTRRPDGIGQGIYTAEMTARTYAELLRRTAQVLTRDPGATVILDGSYSSVDDREQVRKTARKLGAAVCFLLCECDREETLRRLNQRAQDPRAVSDGRPSIYEHQIRTFQPPDPNKEPDVCTLNSAVSMEELLARAESLLNSCSPS